MPLEPLRVGRVQRDLLLPLRARVLSLPGRPVRGLSRDLAPATRHWAAWRGDQLVGCVSVMAVRGLALRGMAVDPEHQRQGIGRQLLQLVVQEVDAPLWCNARLSAVPFYTRLGWTEEGPVFQLQDRGPHQRLTVRGAGLWNAP